MSIDLFKWAKDVKILVSHVNVHQKHQLRRGSVIKYRMVHSVNSLFAHPFLSLPNRFMNKMAVVAEMKVMGLTMWTTSYQGC